MMKIVLRTAYCVLLGAAAMAYGQLPPMPPTAPPAKGILPGIHIATTSEGSTTNAAPLLTHRDGVAAMDFEPVGPTRTHGQLRRAYQAPEPVNPAPYYRVSIWPTDLTAKPIQLDIRPQTDAAFFRIETSLEVGE